MDLFFFKIFSKINPKIGRLRFQNVKKCLGFFRIQRQRTHELSLGSLARLQVKRISGNGLLGREYIAANAGSITVRNWGNWNNNIERSAAQYDSLKVINELGRTNR